MGITIKRYSCKLTYEDAATLDEFWELAKRTERSLDREQQRHWDGRECGEHIIAAQGVLPYGATPEELVCQQETLDEILAVLPSAPRPSGSGSCSIRSTISAMRKYHYFSRRKLRLFPTAHLYTVPVSCAPAGREHPLCVCSFSAGQVSSVPNWRSR